MTACTQSRYCCVLSELLGAPVLFNMYSVENSFAAISLSQNITVCPSLPQNKDTLSHSEDTLRVEVGLSHHSVPLCWLGGGNPKFEGVSSGVQLRWELVRGPEKIRWELVRGSSTGNWSGVPDFAQGPET